MSKTVKILLFFLSITIIAVYVFVIAQAFFHFHPNFVSTTTQQAQGYIPPNNTTPIATEGYYTTTGSLSTLIFVGKILSVANTNGTVSIQAEVAKSGKKTLTQQFLVFNSQDASLPFYFIKQKTKNLFPASSDTTSTLLHNADMVTTSLNGIKNKLAVFSVTMQLPTTIPTPSQTPTLPPQFLPGNVIKKYLVCNNQFYGVLRTGSLSPLSCTTYIQKISVYEP